MGYHKFSIIPTCITANKPETTVITKKISACRKNFRQFFDICLGVFFVTDLVGSLTIVSLAIIGWRSDNDSISLLNTVKVYEQHHNNYLAESDKKSLLIRIHSHIDKKAFVIFG